jgi:hypothetical protein
MWAMLDVHAAWSDSLCSTPSGTRCIAGRTSSRGGSKSAGTKPAELIARRYRTARTFARPEPVPDVAVANSLAVACRALR